MDWGKVETNQIGNYKNKLKAVQVFVEAADMIYVFHRDFK